MDQAKRGFRRWPQKGEEEEERSMAKQVQLRQNKKAIRAFEKLGFSVIQISGSHPMIAKEALV